MGTQHNSHVYNATDIKIKVILIDNDGRNSEGLLDSKESTCFPTVKGSVTLNVMRMGDSPDGDPPKSETCYTAPSDTSFIIKMKEQRLVIARSEYGNIMKEATD